MKLNLDILKIVLLINSIGVLYAGYIETIDVCEEQCLDPSSLKYAMFCGDLCKNMIEEKDLRLRIQDNLNSIKQLQHKEEKGDTSLFKMWNNPFLDRSMWQRNVPTKRTPPKQKKGGCFNTCIRISVKRLSECRLLCNNIS